MELLRSLLKDVVHLFYPNLCLLCEVERPLPEQYFCLGCEMKLPYTDHFTEIDNDLMKHFWGRSDIEMGAALFSFKQHNKVRKMIHRLKYKGRKEIGLYLGHLLGQAFLDSSLFEDVDIVIPVPLSKKKLRKRSYNQAQLIAQGVCEITDATLMLDILIKVKDTPSQTKKTRLERVANVKDIFLLMEHQILKGKHILLIDDVITTGATLEACANLLLKIPDVKVSVLTAGISR